MTSASAGHIILTPTQPVGSRNLTQDLLIRSRAHYKLSYCGPRTAEKGLFFFLALQIQGNSR